MKNSLFRITCAAASLLLINTAPLFADEVEDTISEALKKYQAGEFSGAGGSLQYALNLIAEKKAETVKKAIPETIGDWKGGEISSESLSVIGGGLIVSRDFTKGDLSAKVQITLDSPLVQQMLGMLANPMLSGQMGMKQRDVQGEKAMVSAKQGELILVINNTILIKIEASGASEDDILALARGLDIKLLKGLK